MGKIADVSHHQGSIDWEKASKELDLVIIRVQYGSGLIDRKYKEYVAGAKKYKIPFGHYAYAKYVNVQDAIVEAKDLMSRADKDAKFLVVDVEEQTCHDPKDIVPATQAFIDTCKAQGWKVGLYTGHHFYEPFNMDKVKADFLWIPRYGGAKPKYACDIWQYTETGKLSGVGGNVDLNYLNGGKSLAYFTSKDSSSSTSKSPVKTPVKSPSKNTSKSPAKEKVIGEIVITTGALNVRSNPSLSAKIVHSALKGQKFPVYEKKGQFLRIGVGKWVSNPENKYAKFVTKGSSTPTKKTEKKYHIVVKGDTVSELAKKYGSSIKSIKDWNKLDKNYTIYVGKKIRVK